METSENVQYLAIEPNSWVMWLHGS